MFYIERRYLPRFGTSVTAIHDERAVPIDVFRPDSEFQWIGNLVFRYPAQMGGIFLVGLVVIVFGILSGIVSLLIKDKMNWRAKHATAETIAKEVEYIEYVKSHFPEKMPKGPEAAISSVEPCQTLPNCVHNSV